LRPQQLCNNDGNPGVKKTVNVFVVIRLVPEKLAEVSIDADLVAVRNPHFSERIQARIDRAIDQESWPLIDLNCWLWVS
jgi:hypothetical protein